MIDKSGVMILVENLRGMGYKISEESLSNGLGNAVKLSQLKGRWQILQTQPWVVADVAHNEGGLAETLAQIKSYQYRQLHIVLGFVKDKDIAGILTLLPPQAHYYCCAADNPRSLPAVNLLYLINKLNMKGSLYRDVNKALAAAREKASENDFIYVGGSTFVVSELDEI